MQWRLRGKGWANIKRMREPGTYRFLFREEGTMTLRANHRSKLLAFQS